MTDIGAAKEMTPAMNTEAENGVQVANKPKRKRTTQRAVQYNLA